MTKGRFYVFLLYIFSDRNFLLVPGNYHSVNKKIHDYGLTFSFISFISAGLNNHSRLRMMQHHFNLHHFFSLQFFLNGAQRNVFSFQS